MKSPESLKKILIAVEDSPYSDQAVKYGFGVARKFNAEVVLVHVNEIAVTTPYIADPFLNESPLGGADIPELMHIQEDAAKLLFNRIEKEFAEGITLYTFNKLGRPKDEIIATAEECNADLIILGTHGRTGFDHFISGSVAESVLRRAKCPVLIIPNPAPAP
jgi:nucleotide-binding universal stress UspA family protein